MESESIKQHFALVVVLLGGGIPVPSSPQIKFCSWNGACRGTDLLGLRKAESQSPEKQTHYSVFSFLECGGAHGKEKLWCFFRFVHRSFRWTNSWSRYSDPSLTLMLMTVGVIVEGGMLFSLAVMVGSMRPTTCAFVHLQSLPTFRGIFVCIYCHSFMKSFESICALRFHVGNSFVTLCRYPRLHWLWVNMVW